MPTNSDVQYRLARAATTTADQAALRLDPGASEWLGAQIAGAAERLEAEGLLDSEADLERAEEAFGKLVRASAAAARRGGIERRGGRGPFEALPPREVTAAQLSISLKGLCPMWPIC